MGNIGPNLGHSGFNRGLSQPPAPQSPLGAEPSVLPAQALPTGSALPGVNPGVLAALLASEGAWASQLTPAQMAILLRNLLQLPKELVQLMAMLANLEETATQPLLKALLSEDVQIPLDTLQQLLQTQGHKAREKLLKLLQNTPAPGALSGQTGELLQALSRFSDSAGTPQSYADTLQNTIALYLPYYPLPAPQRFSFQYQPGDDENTSGGKASTLTILLQTIRLGPLKAVIQSQPTTAPEVFVEHHLSDQALSNALETQIKTDLAAEHCADVLLTLYASTPVRPSATQAHPSESTEKKPKQEARFIPEAGFSARMILVAYVLTRSVLEFDLTVQA